MPLSFPCTAALLCFTVLVGSENRRSVDGRGPVYWRCGPRDECVCLADFPPVESDGSKAVCGDNVAAIISELLQRGLKTSGPEEGEDEKDGATVTETTLPSFGRPDLDLGKQFDGNGSRIGQWINLDEEEEKEIAVRRKKHEDSIRSTEAAAGEEEGERPTKMEQRLSDRLGPQSIIDQHSHSRDAVESENGNSGRRMEMTVISGRRQVYPGSGPRYQCSFNNTASLTLFGNYQELETLACLSGDGGLKRLSLQERPLDMIDGETFNRFQDFRLKELQVTRSNLSSVLPGAFRAFKESLVALDLSENRLEVIDARSISELPLLKTLNVSANRLQNASFLLFANAELLINLQILDLSSNAIDSFSMAAGTDEIKPASEGQSRASRPESSDPVEREILRYLTTRDSADGTTTSRTTTTGSTKFRNLQTIDLSMNRLTYLANFSFVDLVELRELRLAGNAIADIESDAFVLSHRYFTTETVTQRTRKGTEDDDTQEYYISSALCNWGWPNLRLVDLSYNNLSHIREGALSGALCTVRRLVLSHNRIAQLPRYLVERLPYLEHIDLSHNELAWLDVGAFTNPSLVSISLAHNRLRKIISMTFLYLPAVTHIDLSHNGLVYLYKFAFYRLCSSGLSVTISLRSNQLQTDGVWKLMSTFQHLGDTNCNVRIDLSDNNVTRFLGDALDFIKDRLAAADFQHFSHWSQVAIDLFENQIHCDCALVDDFRAMTKIYESIAATNASSSPRKKSNLDAWRQLGCSEVSPEGGGDRTATTVEMYLRSADCDRGVCFEPCTCERDIDGFAYSVNCSHLQLVKLPTMRVDPVLNSQALSRITSVDLSENNLTSVQGSFFRQMPALEEIHLRNNGLTSVPLELLNITGLRCLTLAGNPLQCKCSDVLGRNELFRHSAGIIRDWDEITCTTEILEDKPSEFTVPRVNEGTGNKRRNMRYFLSGNISDLCTQNDSFGSLLELSSANTQHWAVIVNWVQVCAVCISAFLLIIAAVSIRGLKKWLDSRKPRKRRSHDRSKVSGQVRQGDAKLELLVYCDQSQKKWVRRKLVTPIRREFSHLEINVIVETPQTSTTRFRRDFPADADHPKKQDVSRTILIFLSKDWISRMASRFQVDDFVDLSSTSSAFVPTVLILTSKDVNISDVHALHCATEQFPCLEVDDPLFQSYLFQHLERSFRIEARPSNTNAILKLTKGHGYESILNNLRKY